MVVGGAEIYKKFLNFADEIQLTLIDKEFEGDTYFPEIDENIFEEKKRDSFNNGEFDYHFITYKRK